MQIKRSIVYVLLVCSFLLSCGKSSSDILAEISGVWKAKGKTGLLTINYSDSRFSLLLDDMPIAVTVGNIDNQNKTVNLNVTLNDGKPGIWTIRQMWSPDGKNFHLIFTIHDGSQEELTFVRKISSDDLNRIANLYAKLQPMTKQNSIKEVAPKNDINKSDSISTKSTNQDLPSLKQEFAQADKEINSVYKEIMSNLSPGVKAELKREQIAWIKEKDNRCNAITDEANRLSCLIDMTKDRTTFLRNYSAK